VGPQARGAAKPFRWFTEIQWCTKLIKCWWLLECWCFSHFQNVYDIISRVWEKAFNLSFVMHSKSCDLSHPVTSYVINTEGVTLDHFCTSPTGSQVWLVISHHRHPTRLIIPSDSPPYPFVTSSAIICPQGLRQEGEMEHMMLQAASTCMVWLKQSASCSALLCCLTNLCNGPRHYFRHSWCTGHCCHWHLSTSTGPMICFGSAVRTRSAVTVNQNVVYTSHRPQDATSIQVHAYLHDLRLYPSLNAGA
jgi:hypothetical protein